MAAVVPASRASWVILRAAAGPTVIVGVLAIVLAGVLRGWGGVLAAVLGTVVVLAFFAIGQYVLGIILERNPESAMTAALVLYLVKVVLLFALIAVFQGSPSFDSRTFALTILACTLTWTCAEVWALGRTRMLVVEPGSGPGTAPPDHARSAAPPASIDGDA